MKRYEEEYRGYRFNVTRRRTGKWYGYVYAPTAPTGAFLTGECTRETTAVYACRGLIDAHLKSLRANVFEVCDGGHCYLRVEYVKIANRGHFKTLRWPDQLSLADLKSLSKWAAKINNKEL